MTIFALSIMPLCLILWALTFGEKKYTVSFLTGLLSGIIVTGFKGFFTFAHRVVPFSFSENFLYFFIFETFLPVAVLFGFFCLISRDDFEFKAKSFFPLTAAFYLTFLPYLILSGNKAIHTNFELFFKPVLFEVMLFSIGSSFVEFAKYLKSNKKLIFIPCLTIIFFLVLPAIIETVYTLNISPAIYIVLSCIYILLPSVPLFLPQIIEAQRNKKSSEDC